MTWLDLRRRARDAVNFSGRKQEGVVQAAKMAVAAVAAWLIARSFDESQSFIAPYAAVFMMGGTVYRSMLDAARQVITVVLGVLVAYVVAVLVPWSAVALGVAVFLGMLLGRWHRLKLDGIWVGVVALLMITYGTADDTGYLFIRVGEALLGAVVGVAVNIMIRPPLYLRETDRAVAGVSAETVELLESIAVGLRDSGWDHPDAQRWRRSARALEVAVHQAQDTAGEGRESVRLNPRWLWSRSTRPATEESALDTLYEMTEQVQEVTDALTMSADPDSTAPRTGPVFDRLLADLLGELARVVAVYQRSSDDWVFDRTTLAAALDRARDSRRALARQVPWPDQQPPQDWSAHAAALLAVERAFQTLLEAQVDSDER
jgi:uncharacterized membrane protein YccC